MGVSDKIAFLDPAAWQGRRWAGTWIAAGGPARAVTEPATGQPLSHVGVATPQDVAQATQAAAQAQKQWALVPPREKAAVFHRAAQLFQQHFDELALYVTRESGGILPKGQHEIREAITLCNLAAAMPMQSQGQLLPSAAGTTSIARRMPRGVVGVISPFNFPLDRKSVV